MSPPTQPPGASPDPSVPPKPRWRGVLHQWGAVVAALAGAAMVATAPTTRAAWAAAGYSASLVLLYTVSATYHRVTWQPNARAWMRRADHASIFILIAGTYTPIALVGLPPSLGNKMLWMVWTGAVVGVVQSLFWIRAPKVITAVLAVLCGWVLMPFWSAVHASLSDMEMTLLLVGGILYTCGAVVYALKRPALWPHVFGYHELFHLCTLIAAALHFTAVLSILHR